MSSLAVGLHGEHRARLDRPAVQQDGAGAAVGRVAADVRAGEPQHLADQVDEQQARLDVGLVLLAVDRRAVIAHARSLPSYRRARRARRERARRQHAHEVFLVLDRPAQIVGGLGGRRRPARPRCLIAASSGALALQRGLGLRRLDRRQADVGEPDADLVARAAGRERELRRRPRPWRSRRPCARASGRRRRCAPAASGIRISTRISSGRSAVANGPVKNDGDGDPALALRARRRRPRRRAPASSPGWSLAGSPWARLPPTVARLRTSGSAITSARVEEQRIARPDELGLLQLRLARERADPEEAVGLADVRRAPGCR